MTDAPHEGNAISVKNTGAPVVRLSSAKPHDDDATGSSFTLGFVWYVVQRWGKLAIPLGIVLTAVAVAIVFWTFEPQYKSEALLQIKTHRPMVVSQVDDGRSSEFVETQKHLLKSIPVLNKVLANPEVQRMPELRRKHDPRVWLEKQLEVKAIGRSDLFSITYQGPNPDNCRIVVDTVVQAYFALQSAQSNDQIGRLLKVLRDLKEEQLAKVARLEKQLHETAKRISGDSAYVIDPRAGQLLEVNPALRDLQQKLADAEMDRQFVEAELKSLEDGSTVSSPSEIEIEAGVAASPEVVDLEGRIARAQKELRLLRPSTAHYKTTSSKIEDLQSKLADAKKAVRETLLEKHGEQIKAFREDSLTKTRELARQHRLREDTLRTRIAEERRKIENKTGGRFELEFLQNDVARAKAVAEKIEDRDFALTIEYLSPQRPEQVSVIQPAEIPQAPIQPYPLKQLMLASMAGLFLPLGVFGVLELLSARLYRSEQLLGSSRLTLVGEIAALPSRPLLPYRRSEKRFIRERAIFEESVESLRCFLSVSPEWQKRKALAISSSVSGEGKTSLASQLATSWGRLGKGRTLLIDGDIRDPDIHALFGIAATPGLADVLSGNSDLNEAVVNWNNNLAILPAGTLASNPHRLIAENCFGKLIERAKREYDHIIVDVAPLLSASEVLPILKAVDGVLLCARKDHSRAPQVKLACERLENAGIECVGAVFSGMSSHCYAYQYGEYSG